MAKAALKDEEGSYHQQTELIFKYQQPDFAYDFLYASHLKFCVWFNKTVIIV